MHLLCFHVSTSPKDKEAESAPGCLRIHLRSSKGHPIGLDACASVNAEALPLTCWTKGQINIPQFLVLLLMVQKSQGQPPGMYKAL